MSRKSFTSATVVPTACEDENLSGTTIDCNAVPNKEEVVATPEPLVHAEAEVAPQLADGNQDSTTEASTTPDTDESPKQQSSPPKPFPLPISHGTGMPHNVELTDRGGFKLVNNYRALATTFKHLQPFARCPDGSYSSEITCVLCNESKPTSVFFPCQHMCVCNTCISTNDMSPECSLNLERCVCPVCSADIGLILPHTGNEEDAYWKWVLATKPRLPSQFTKNFKNAVQMISDNSVLERRVSTIGAITPSDPTRKLKLQRSPIADVLGSLQTPEDDLHISSTLGENGRAA